MAQMSGILSKSRDTVPCVCRTTGGGAAATPRSAHTRTSVAALNFVQHAVFELSKLRPACLLREVVLRNPCPFSAAERWAATTRKCRYREHIT
jgi:hypothetical protein